MVGDPSHRLTLESDHGSTQSRRQWGSCGKGVTTRGRTVF